TSTFESKYLGLPTPEGRMKDANFQPFMDRFMKRCSDWDGRFMSFAAKEVHVKSIVQSLPVFTMGVFKLSVGFCDKYERLIREFWWGEEEGRRKVHWTAWDQLVKPKRAGGIGFRDMQIFNQALLARQGWRLLQRPKSLCARVLKSKYYPNGELLDTSFASDASQAWKGIEHGLELLKKGLIWRVGNGKRIQIQRDQWIPRKSGLKVATFKRRSRLRWVNQLLTSDGSEWNVNLMKDLFHGFDAEEICKIKLPNTSAEDCVAWHSEKNGIFTVRSAYKLGFQLKQLVGADA
uniref:Reverse transcriptase zinc-binding domain-containing protein n=3 Tax=Aegilops tauschii subsp. strangulata TaxID=200361 RepID=A0A453S5H7_AEGTS